MGTGITVKTLLGHKNLQFSIDCLKSFVDKSEDRIFLEIFEDGTLTNNDEHLLYSQLNNIIVVKKTERDDRLKSVLYKYPNCSKYRNDIPYAQKIFDVMLYDDNDLLFIDSDIFFLKKFKLPRFDLVPVFVSDTEHAYSFTPLEFLKIKLPIYPRINSGFFYFPQKLFNLDFIEQLLQDDVINRGFKRRNPWFEQAVWSFLAARAKNVYFFDKAQIAMAKKKLAINARTVAVHLVSTYRSHYAILQNTASVANFSGDAIEIKFEKGVKFLNKFEFGLQKLLKRTKRELGIK
jgi:hypothetical protein